VEPLLILGAGDIARRALPALASRYAVAALVRGDPGPLAGRGVRTLAGDLDRPGSLAVLAGTAALVLHAAPPAETGARDARTRNLVAALSARGCYHAGSCTSARAACTATAAAP